MFIGCVTYYIIDLTIVVLGTLISVMLLIVPELYIEDILLRNFNDIVLFLWSNINTTVGSKAVLFLTDSCAVCCN